MRAVIYLRSASEDAIALQAKECRRFAQERHLSVVAEYVDVGFDANGSRPSFDEMIKRIEQGGVGVAVVWSLDRVTRSMRHLCRIMKVLERDGCDLVVVAAPDLELGMLNRILRQLNDQ